jgi:alkylated DNA repair dioxygenase AlkB
MMTENNLLPYDGEAVLMHDAHADFNWAAVTRTLIDTISWRVETARLFGRELAVPRMTAWFGDAAYRYSGILHEPAAMPMIIQRLRKRAEALASACFNSVLLNLYRSGSDSVGWHSDHEAGLGEQPTIASLSLGGTRRFQFRHRRTKETIAIELRSGDWLMMRGDTQRCWVHQVPKTASAVDPRVNLTFRRMMSQPSRHGRRS